MVLRQTYAQACPKSAMRVQGAIGSLVPKRLSRFAAPFIGARAKILVAESCVEACPKIPAANQTGN